MKKLAAVCLALFVTAISVAACSNRLDDTANYTGTDFEYEDHGDGTCTITGYVGEQIGDLNIPGKINGRRVTAIGRSAFYYCDGFTGSLTIPEGVTTIGNSAFWNCTGLTGALTIPNSVTTIEGWAFNHCKGLTGALVIPENVTTIGREAFAHNSFTGSLIIPESVTAIENRAFIGCAKLTRVEFLGDAPVDFGKSVFFVGEKNPFTKRLEITYDSTKSGWSTPEWNEYPAYPKSV